jgi:hypothetical protein
MSKISLLQKTLLESLGGSSNIINESLRDITSHILDGDIGAIRAELAEYPINTVTDAEKLLIAVSHRTLTSVAAVHRDGGRPVPGNANRWDRDDKNPSRLLAYSYVVDRIANFRKTERALFLEAVKLYPGYTTAILLGNLGRSVRPRYTTEELRDLALSFLEDYNDNPDLEWGLFTRLTHTLRGMGYYLGDEPLSVVRHIVEPVVRLAGETGETNLLDGMTGLDVSPVQVLHMAAIIHERQLDEVADDPDAENYTFWLIPAIFDFVDRDSSRTLDGWEEKLPSNLVGLIKYLMSEGYMA